MSENSITEGISVRQAEIITDVNYAVVVLSLVFSLGGLLSIAFLTKLKAIKHRFVFSLLLSDFLFCVNLLINIPIPLPPTTSGESSSNSFNPCNDLSQSLLLGLYYGLIYA